MNDFTDFRCPACGEKPLDVCEGHPMRVAMLDGLHSVGFACANDHRWLESALYTNGVAKRLRPVVLDRPFRITMTGVKP